MDPISSDSTEEMEDDMFSLTAILTLRMCKRATSSQGETASDFEVSGGKRPKRSDLDEEARKSLAVIVVDPHNQAPMPCWHWRVPPKMPLERLVHRWRMGFQPRGLVIDECLKHSYYTRVSLAFSCCFDINYIVLGVRPLIMCLF